MGCPRQVIVVDTPQAAAGAQHASGVGQHGQGRGVVLGGSAMEGRIGDDDVDALVGQDGQSVTPVGDDVESVRPGGETSRVDGLPGDIGGVDGGVWESACQVSGDDAVAAPQIDDVGVDVGRDGVEVIEEQGRSGVEAGGVDGPALQS